MYRPFPMMLRLYCAYLLAPWPPFSLRRSGDAGGDWFAGWVDGPHCRRSGALGQLPVGGGCDRGWGVCALPFAPDLLFLFLSILRTPGYMARPLFIMDRPLRRFGLSGKAFIPMLMGVGVYGSGGHGARTMENEKDRRMTIMLEICSSSRCLGIWTDGLGVLPRYSGLGGFSLCHRDSILSSAPS